jgi:LuxR family quorum sensing-dependent transcriptional regulator
MQFACLTHKKGSCSMFLSDPLKKQKNSNPTITLTHRQRECLQYIADGHTGRSIAHRLGISERMVRFHLAGARQRLNAGSTTQAVYLATKSGIID